MNASFSIKTLMLTALVTWASSPVAHAEDDTQLEPPISQSSVGPKSDSEAKILWKDGKAHFDSAKYSEAAAELRRLVDRYPGKPGYLEAHLLLGISYEKLGRHKDALRALKHYAEAQGNLPRRDEARIWIGRTRLSLKQYDEAGLLAQEVLSSSKDLETQVDALILQARARMGLNQEERAADSLESAKQLLLKNSGATSDAPARIAMVTLVLKDRVCAKLASKGPLSEAQALDQFERRGACLIDSLLGAKAALSEGASASTRGSASDELVKAWHDYRRAADNPPLPGPVPKGKPARTQNETKRYLKELSQALRGRYVTSEARAVDILSGLAPSAKDIASAIHAEAVTP